MIPTIYQVDFGMDGNAELHKFIEEQVQHIKMQVRNFREEILPRYVRIYRGTPAEKEATFPWPGAANLVIQIAGTHCDELLARVMSIWQVAPLFVAEIYADYEKGRAADEADMIQRFLDKMAFEPEELDLYRVEQTVFSSTIRYGTGVAKVPYEYLVEKQPISIPGFTSPGTNNIAQEAKKLGVYNSNEARFQDIVRRDGPHPEVVPLNCWGIDPRYPNLHNAPFFYHRIPKTKLQLKEMMLHPEIYDKEKIEKIMEHPDREQPDQFRIQLQESKQMSDVVAAGSTSAEWDVYECWFRYTKDGVHYSLVAYYHELTNTVLGVIFNFYPKNESPFEDAKLAYDDDTYFGYGLCEMLEAYQEEISKLHNWRRNNRDFATTGIGRVNKNSKLSSIVQLFPGLLIPADEGEIEPLNFGAGALQYGVEDEQLTLTLASQRSGIDPANGGMGSGVVNPKKGIYSAGATFAVMQQANNRNMLRTNDMRSAHVRIGRKLLDIYSHFGVAKKLRLFGDRAPILNSALESYKSDKLGLAIKAATASINKEVEKQNDILLSATLERFYAGDAQIIQMLINPGMPPELKDYYTEVLYAKNALMYTILRNFGRHDVDRLVPVPNFMKQNRQGAMQNGANGATGVNGQAVQAAGQTQGNVPTGTGQPPVAIPGVVTQ